jgi:hypothetical protein
MDFEFTAGLSLRLLDKAAQDMTGDQQCSGHSDPIFYAGSPAQWQKFHQLRCRARLAIQVDKLRTLRSSNTQLTAADSMVPGASFWNDDVDNCADIMAG